MSHPSGLFSRRIPNDLLQTKLTQPRVSPNWVRRDALLAWLDSAEDARLTLITAPAGFGKTSLVSQWAGLRAVTSSAAASVAWLSLDAADNDPIQFWRYLIAACQAFEPDETAPGEIGQATLARLLAQQHASTQPPAQPGEPLDAVALLTPFLNDLAQLSGNPVLVIEDYHVITQPLIHEALAFWLDHLPQSLRVIVLTRTDPPLPLSRWRARDQLRELRAEQLRFSRGEIDAFVRSLVSLVPGAALSTDAVTQLDARLEGWPAGWRMWALLFGADLRRDHTPEFTPQATDAFVTQFDGQHQHVIEFFTGEVLASLTPPTRDFLLRTAFLDRLNSDLCDSVTGAMDGAAQLQQLEQANLFLQRLGADSPNASIIWYRYHTLFAEALRHLARRQLDEADRRQLQRRAGQWLAAHEQWPAAIEAALAAQDTALAADFLLQYLDRHPASLLGLRPWLEALTPADLEAHPTLYLTLAAAILYTSDRRGAATYARLKPLLARAESHWRRQRAQHPKTDLEPLDELDERLGEVLAFRASLEFWQGNFPMTLHWARAALALLPLHNAEWRGMCQLDVALDELRQGHLNDALDMMIEARALCSASGNQYLAMAAVLVLGQASHLRGELYQARQHYQYVLEASTTEDMSSDQQMAHLGLARVEFDSDSAEATESHLTLALDAGPQLGEENAWDEARIALAELRHRRGDTDQARQLLHEVSAQTRAPVGAPTLTRLAQLTLARLAIADGDLVAAQRALATVAQLGADSHLEAESIALIQTRLSLAQGQLADVVRQINRWRKEAETQARNRRAIEWALLEAQLHLLKDDPARAELAISDALVLSQMEGIVRPWIELGAPLLAMIRTRAEADAAHSFLQRVLAALGEANPAEAGSQTALPEPLSAQERRVLRLMAAGMTNLDIARELTVSVNTVKSQTQSIYRKLNVNSRSAAGETARRLRLI